MASRPPNVLRGSSITDQKVGIFTLIREASRNEEKLVEDIPDANRLDRLFHAWESPFIFTLPAKRRTPTNTNLSDLEWADIIAWNKMWPSDEMYLVFNNIRMKIQSAPDATLEEHWIRRETAHKKEVIFSGETEEEFKARGGIKRILPVMDTVPDAYYLMRKESKIMTVISSNHPK